MKYFFQLLFVSVLSLAIINACNNNSSKTTAVHDSAEIQKEYNGDSKVTVDTNTSKVSTNPMSGMIDRMKSISMTGDFDIDFANMMIEHHQGGIEMSEQEVRNGKNDTLKSMAQKIIDDQNKEINKLRDFIKTYKPSGMKHAEGELSKTMHDMEGKMSSMSNTGDQDKDFAANMKMHHEDGIAMAKMQLKNGMSGDLKKMASAMIDKQSKEVARLNKWLGSH
jgi:uncharacterized protein (DUF305 family)